MRIKAANLENSAVATGLEKVTYYSNLKKGNAKECSDYHTIALVPHASKVMFNILQARLQKYVNRTFRCSGFRKGKGARNQIASICWIIGKSKRIPEKHLLLLH